MGDAPGTLTPRLLADQIRTAIGPPGEQLGHTVDVIVTEICRCWPARHMAKMAANPKSTGDECRIAIDVLTAKVRENIECRWGCKPSHQAALDLVLRACVVELAAIWFSGIEARIQLSPLIAAIRHGDKKIS